MLHAVSKHIYIYIYICIYIYIHTHTHTTVLNQYKRISRVKSFWGFLRSLNNGRELGRLKLQLGELLEVKRIKEEQAKEGVLWQPRGADSDHIHFVLKCPQHFKKPVPH